MSENNGWIKLHRQIKDHWIWKDANKLKWWYDILLTVNSEPAKVNIGYDIFDCGRGESLLSIGSWAEQWGVSKDTARNFLILLERSHMITRVSLGKTTRLTVCNYDTYNECLHVNQTRSVRNADTNKNILSKDSIIKKRRDDFKNELSAYLPTYGKDMLNEFYTYWIELNKSKTKMKFESEKTWELNLRLAKWKNIGEQFNRKQQKNYSDNPPLMADN